MKLYEITAEMDSILSQIDPETGEISEEQAGALDKLEMTLKTKVENIAKFVRNQTAEADAYKAEAARFTTKSNARKNTATRLKRYLLDELHKLGVRKVQGDLLTVRVQKSAPSVEIVVEQLVPAQFWVQPPAVINKTALKTALKGGAETPGARLVQGEHVRIV